MTDDTAMTGSLLKLAEDADDDYAVETIVLHERDLMATTEFRSLRQLAEVPDEDDQATGDTLELEEMQFIETAELKQLLDADPEPDDKPE